MPDYSRSDGWVLHALTRAGGTAGTSLKRLVFVGDGINHSVFGAAELSNCLGRLIAAGLATTTKDGYAVTAEVAGRLEKGGLTRQRGKADRLVQKREVATLTPSHAAPTESECRAAVKAYVEKANTVVKELSRRAV